MRAGSEISEISYTIILLILKYLSGAGSDYLKGVHIMNEFSDEFGGRIYDYKRAEVVDPMSGVVEEDHLFESKPSIRASDYAEWESKRSHEVLVSDEDRKLMAPIWRVGEKIGAPEWLRRDVFWFYKMARALKARPEFKGKGLHTSDERCILAVYYVVAKRRGLLDLADRIAMMPCGEDGMPCYVNRKKGDSKFKKYLNIALRYAAVIYPNNLGRDPIAVLNRVASEVPMPESVVRRAAEIIAKLYPALSGRRLATIVAAALGIALEEVFPESWRTIFKIVCRALNVSEISVRSLIAKVKESKLV